MDPPVAPAAAEERQIELRLQTMRQLFETLDPSPFHEKDLDRDAEEYIVSQAREHPADAPLVLRLHLPDEERAQEPQRVVQDAVRNYFSYRADIARLELRRLLEQGRRSMVVGLVFLAACMLVRELLPRGPTAEWIDVAREGLLIVGWVAMWRPLELLLYDWWPVLGRRRTYLNLARTRVEVRFRDAAAHAS